MLVSKKILRALSGQDYVHIDSGFVRSLLPQINKYEADLAEYEDRIEKLATEFAEYKQMIEDAEWRELERLAEEIA